MKRCETHQCKTFVWFLSKIQINHCLCCPLCGRFKFLWIFSPSLIKLNIDQRNRWWDSWTCFELFEAYEWNDSISSAASQLLCVCVCVFSYIFILILIWIEMETFALRSHTDWSINTKCAANCERPHFQLFCLKISLRPRTVGYFGASNCKTMKPIVSDLNVLLKTSHDVAPIIYTKKKNTTNQTNNTSNTNEPKGNKKWMLIFS